MKQVSSENLKAALEKVDSLSEEQLDSLMEEFASEQEDLISYVLQAGIEFNSEVLNVYSIYYFTVVYEAFRQQGLTISTIETEQIDEFQEPFLLALDAINKEEDYAPMQEITNQPHLMQFMVDEIEAEDEDGIVLEEQLQTQLYLVVAGMIGLLNAAIAE